MDASPGFRQILLEYEALAVAAARWCALMPMICKAGAEALRAGDTAGAADASSRMDKLNAELIEATKPFMGSKE